MEIAVFDTRTYDRKALENANKRHGFQFRFLETRLTEQTADLSKGCPVACCFVNDRLTEKTLQNLKTNGVRLIALRSAGFNNVDLAAARLLDFQVVRVPEYSPYAVAEHAVALLMTLNRKIHRANNRVHEMNFSLEGLVGYDLHGKTVGILGTGRIGEAFLRIMKGFGCKLLAFDRTQNADLIKELNLQYVDLETLYRESDVISLHVPLNAQTRHIIGQRAFDLMKPSAILINTGRGGLIDTKSLIDSLKDHRIAGACLDVYEEEEGIFFSDYSDYGIQDDMLARLLTFPNVIVTSHQGFLTQEALTNIADTTLQNIQDFIDGKTLINSVLTN